MEELGAQTRAWKGRSLLVPALPLLIPGRADTGWPPSASVTVTGTELLHFTCIFFPYPMNPSISIYEIGMISPIFQMREWKETSGTVRTVRSGARLPGC